MKTKQYIKTQNKNRRHARIRSVVIGSADRPRLSFHKSNSHIRLQIIDDNKGTTLVSVSSLHNKDALRKKAQTAGALIAQKAKEQGITKVVFDRGGFRYGGIVKECAEAARTNGLDF